MSRHVRCPSHRVPSAFPSTLRTLTAACLLCAGGAAHALEFEGGVGYTATYSDNVESEEDGTADWEHMPTLTLGASHDSTSYSIDAQYRAQHRVYARETYPDDTFVSGRTIARVALLPNALDWTLSHSSTETPVNSRRADTPDNSQTTNVLATGPQARFQLDGRTSLGLGASLQQVTAARSINDNLRWSANAALDRSLDAATTLGVSLQHSDIDYDSDFGQDYRSSDLRLTASREQGARTRLRIEVGGVLVSTSDRPTFANNGAIVRQGGSDDFNWTGLVSIDRELATTLRGSLTASRRVVDSGSDLGGGIAGGGTSFVGRSDERQSYLQEQVGLSLNRSSSRLDTRIGVLVYRQDFDGLREDETRRSITLDARYALNPRLDLTANGLIEQAEFENVEDEELRRNAAIGVRWRPLRRLGISCAVSWNDRDGARRDGLTYDETNVTLGVNYGF